jgi:fused signal recognition particle receptor
MLKFWKKKPTDTAEEQRQDAPATAADAAAQDLTPTLGEVLAEAAPPESAPAADEAVEYLPEQATPAPATAETAAAGKRSWRERLSGSGFARGLSTLFSRNPKLDDDLLDQLETTLITGDVGVEASTQLVESLRKRMHKREFADANALLTALRKALVDQLIPVQQPLDVSGRKPFLILTVGINGVGKTTTIGKLARRFRDERRGVMLAAGDTFRAAAVEQLKTWGARNDVPVISQGQDADSASVIFDALQAARSRDVDVLIADTAGRLHTQGGLMDELGKIARVLKKIDSDAPHEVLMVIDGTTGQNAVSQVRQFRQIVGVTGLVVTKLDGTAKGGVVFALAREFGLPIRFIGLGETATDLRVFDAQAFVDGLLPAALGHA